MKRTAHGDTKAVPNPAVSSAIVDADSREAITALLRRHGADGIADRSAYLCALLDDDPDEGPVNLESLRAMALFLTAPHRRRLPDPLIGVTPDGCIQVEWSLPPSGVLAMEFLPSSLIRFAAVSDPFGDSIDLRRVHGTLSTPEAVETARSFMSLLHAH